MARKRKKKREDQKKISEKVRLLRHEGKSESAALGEAYGMLRSDRLGRGGRYHRKGRRRSRRS